MSSPHTIAITINAQPLQLSAENPTLSQAIEQWGARAPFAVALNTQFIPRSQYSNHLLKSGDKIEIISPVTGG